MWLPHLWLVVKDRKRIYSPLPQQHWDTPIKRKKKDNAIDILGEIQKSNNDFRVYLEKKQKRDEERLKLEVEKVAVQKSLLSFLEKSINKD
nr:unnamed protein product [Callosobruchus analis]CAI5869938.1 unnamed protein product [Callosobruchus analis]